MEGTGDLTDAMPEDDQQLALTFGDEQSLEAIKYLPASLRRSEFDEATPAALGAAPVRFVVGGRDLQTGLAAIRIADAEQLTVEITTSALRLSLRAAQTERVKEGPPVPTDTLFATTVIDLPELSDVPAGQILRFTCPHDALAKWCGVVPVRSAGSLSTPGKSWNLGTPRRVTFKYSLDAQAGDAELSLREEAASAFAKPVSDVEAQSITRLSADPIAIDTVLPWADIAEVGRADEVVPAKLLGQALRWAFRLKDRKMAGHQPLVCVEDGWAWGARMNGSAVTAFHSPRLSRARLRVEAARVPVLAKLLDRMSDQDTRLSQADRFALFADERLACGVVTTKAQHVPLATITKLFAEQKITGGTVLGEVLAGFPFSLARTQDCFVGLHRADDEMRLVVSSAKDAGIGSRKGAGIAFVSPARITLTSGSVREGDEADQNGLINAGWINGGDLYSLYSILFGKSVAIDLRREMLALSVSEPTEGYRAAVLLGYSQKRNQQPLLLTEDYQNVLRGTVPVLEGRTENSQATAPEPTLATTADISKAAGSSATRAAADWAKAAPRGVDAEADAVAIHVAEPVEAVSAAAGEPMGSHAGAEGTDLSDEPEATGTTNPVLSPTEQTDPCDGEGPSDLPSLPEHHGSGTQTPIHHAEHSEAGVRAGDEEASCTKEQA